MMTHDEIRQQLSDYTLGLLPRGKVSLVETHLAECSACRTAVQVDRNIGQLVHNALNAATQPNSHRLRVLMPQPPQQRRLPWQRLGWQKQLAPLVVILTLLIGAFASQSVLPSGGGLPGFVVTAHAATATTTNTPTATAVADGVSKSSEQIYHGEDPQQEPVAAPSAEFGDAPNTPQPLPTPVAAAGQIWAQ